jgi:hypothetical protein
VLCVCETWALKEKDKRMLEGVFHHGAIRRILGINRQRVRDEKITNSAVRKKFLNMPIMMNIVKRRVMKYIGKVFREEKEKALHKSFLTAYCHSPRHVGGQQKSHRDLFIECVRTILSDTPSNAPLKTWIHEAKNQSKWNAHEDDENEDQHTESETEITTTQEVTSLEEEDEHTTHMFNFYESECTDIG